MSRMINGIYVIEPEEPQLCEVCGELKETRPFGVNDSNICFACAHKPEHIKESTAKLTAIIWRSKAVVIDI